MRLGYRVLALVALSGLLGSTLMLPFVGALMLPSPPPPSVKTSFGYALTWKAGENIHLVRVANPYEVNRNLKGDRLTPAALAVQYQGLHPDGTPVGEAEFKGEEATASQLAKK